MAVYIKSKVAPPVSALLTSIYMHVVYINIYYLKLAIQDMALTQTSTGSAEIMDRTSQSAQKMVNAMETINAHFITALRSRVPP